MTVAPPVTSQFERIPNSIRPVCHWAIDEEGRFTQAAGDTQRLFQQSRQELIGRGVSEVIGESLAVRWVLALNRVFAGDSVVEAIRMGKPETSCFVVHLPLRGDNGQIFLAAGFAIDLSVWAESAMAPSNSPAQFLHDEMAQSLSAAGLQLDLLRMDLEVRVPEIAARTAEIQNLLDEALRRMREFIERASL